MSKRKETTMAFDFDWDIIAQGRKPGRKKMTGEEKRKKKAERQEKLKEYNRRYYLTVTKPKRQTAEKNRRPTNEKKQG